MIAARLALGLALLTVAARVGAQMMPVAGGDQRIQTIEYHNDQVIRIRAVPGYQVTVALAPDERIESIAVGDASTWQISANKASNILVIKPLRTDTATDMIVRTDVRTYTFDLIAVREIGGDLPFSIRFRYPAAIPPMGSNAFPPASGEPGLATYRLHGDKALFPAAIRDDGIRTFIEWRPDGPLPAVYSRESGTEMLVNGYMRGQMFVIDSVMRELVFRIDRHRVSAERIVPRAKTR